MKQTARSKVRNVTAHTPTPSVHPVDQHVGARLRAARRAAGLSQEALGRAVGVTFQQLQKYERGSNRISGSRLYDIACELKVPVEAFFEGLPKPVRGRPTVLPLAANLALQETLEACPEAPEIGRLPAFMQKSLRTVLRVMIDGQPAPGSSLAA